MDNTPSLQKKLTLLPPSLHEKCRSVLPVRVPFPRILGKVAPRAVRKAPFPPKMARATRATLLHRSGPWRNAQNFRKTNSGEQLVSSFCSKNEKATGKKLLTRFGPLK